MDRFNRGFERLSFGYGSLYGSLTRRFVRGGAIMLVVYVGLIAVAGLDETTFTVASNTANHFAIAVVGIGSE